MNNTIFVQQRNGERAELIERKENTVILKVLETGAKREIGTATLKRWWKPEVQEQPTVSQVNPDKTETPIEASDIPGPETSVADDLAPQMKLSAVVKKLEDCFDLLNDLYFEGTLERPVITVQSIPKAYGHCSTKQIWKTETEAYYEINIGAEYLNRPSENTAATMCHEMVHLYCRMNDINETCQKGRYHNKTFKLEAEARDLEIRYDRAIGYSLTTPTETFKEKLREAGFALVVPFARYTVEAKKHADREKPHKYACPVCGQSVRSTSDLNLVCGVCEVPLERED